jgi:hypothetical protein
MNQLKNISSFLWFDKLKTGNSFIDAIIFAISMSLVTFLSEQINNMFDNISFKQLDYFLHFFYNKNAITYEGKITNSFSVYEGTPTFNTVFTDRFKALWDHILQNISKEPSIYSIKEQTLYNRRGIDEKSIYMVNQYKKFVVSKKLNIYAYTYLIENKDNNDDNTKLSKGVKVDKIVIEVFSYTSSIEVIKDFVDNITQKYISNIENARHNQRFIYTLIKNTYENNSCELWDENVFHSTRKFENLFFEGKDVVINKIDYFLNNKDWYYNIGIPYSLGIGLCGPPGTGKTSFIKALANYTKRHIVSISLKLIKTKKQLDAVFFENRYNEDNVKNSIGFDNKIVVFEDIDCIGDIVIDRSKKKDNIVLVNSDKKSVDEITTAISKLSAPMEDPPLTLDDILNLWDGIRETPGRIMIISSNHYDDLDPALIRPGRIDIKLELSYASRKTIGEIYKHLFHTELDADILESINENFYTPAEIINIYMNSDRDPQKFIMRILKNSHV